MEVFKKGLFWEGEGITLAEGYLSEDRGFTRKL